MKFSAEELQTIRQARILAKRAKYIRYMCVFFVLLLSSLMNMGFFGVENFAIGVALFVLFAILEPQLHAGPKYEDLVDLLSTKAKFEISQIDVFSN